MVRVEELGTDHSRCGAVGESAPAVRRQVLEVSGNNVNTYAHLYSHIGRTPLMEHLIHRTKVATPDFTDILQVF